MATPAVPFPNIYHHRRVAATSAKPCMICHKPSTSVLITRDNKDFFYTCTGHLLDRGFAIPVVDEAEEERKRKKEELDKAIEEVKKEWEEKVKKRRKDKKERDKDKDKANDEKEKTEEKEKDEKLKKLECDAAPKSGAGEDDGPRIFNLHKYVGALRRDRYRPNSSS